MRATKRIYEGTVKIENAAASVRLDLGKVRDWATVYVNGQKAADLWCEPYVCDISQFVEKGQPASIRVEVVSTWYNALTEDAKLPEKDRRTWTLFGPKADAKYHDAGLLGPATVCLVKNITTHRRKQKCTVDRFDIMLHKKRNERNAK